MKETVFEAKTKTGKVLFYVEKEDMSIKNKIKTVVRIVKSDVIMVVPFLDDDTVVLAKNDRPVVRKELDEFTAGTIDEKVSPEEMVAAATRAAARELEEEIGYKPGKLELLFVGYSSPGVMTERTYFFKATNLQKTERRLEEFEVIEPKTQKVSEVIKMAGSNQIEDIKTGFAVLFCNTFRS